MAVHPLLLIQSCQNTSYSIVGWVTKRGGILKFMGLSLGEDEEKRALFVEKGRQSASQMLIENNLQYEITEHFGINIAARTILISARGEKIAKLKMSLRTTKEEFAAELNIFL